MSDKNLSPQGMPLIIRVDGGLLSTNLLLETLWAAMAKNFFLTLWALITLARHPTRLKHRLYGISAPDIALLPVNPEVLARAQQAEKSGRRVVLVSTACQAQVDALAHHYGFTGPHFGETGHGKEAETPENSWQVRSFLAEMRPYQWVKNALLLLPLLAAHDISPARVFPVLIAIVAFSFGASAIYILNDLLDLSADRQHVEKRNRPIAAGKLPIEAAMLGSLGLGLLAISLGAAVSLAVAGLIVAYMGASLLYSLQLKSMRWVDLLVLASLYTLRVLTGGATSGTSISIWLIGFIFAVFFTLAGVKRLTGLARAADSGRLPGRGYTRANLAGLRMVAGLGVAIAVLAFIGYTYSPEAQALYSNLTSLRLVAIPMAIWLGRMVVLSQRGQEDYDPILFVAHDYLGHLIIASAVALTVLAF